MLLHNLRKLDWYLIVLVLLLAGVGLLTIYGIHTPEALFFFQRQFFFLISAFLTMLALAFFVDYRIFKNYSLVLILLYSAILLSLGFVLRTTGIRGASSWFDLGIFHFEPVELAKIIIIIILAKYFSSRHIEMYRIRHLIISGFYVCPLVLMVLFQPDFGSALILIAIWLGLIIVSGIKLRHLFVLCLIMILLFVSSWFVVLRDYQKERVISFLNPTEDPQGRGYHVTQSLIAIGSGGLFGRGAGLNSQAGLRFLPEQHTDFVFATLAEQRGVAGVFFLFVLFALLLWRIVNIALNSLNNFSRLFAVGLAVMLFVQIVINIGINVGLLPVTGLTLPLVSYGGSSLMSIFIGLGILQSIKIRT